MIVPPSTPTILSPPLRVESRIRIKGLRITNLYSLCELL
jgi:hypothetical protein